MVNMVGGRERKVNRVREVDEVEGGANIWDVKAMSVKKSV
jgi:hypothetical protein